jgi:hypothetical protein
MQGRNRRPDAADAGGVQGQRVIAAGVLSAAEHSALTTFDYWRGKHEGEAAETSAAARMVKVEVAASEITGQFTLSLANGRRIESSWRFADAELARLIRIAESA